MFCVCCCCCCCGVTYLFRAMGLPPGLSTTMLVLVVVHKLYATCVFLMPGSLCQVWSRAAKTGAICLSSMVAAMRFARCAIELAERVVAAVASSATECATACSGIAMSTVALINAVDCSRLQDRCIMTCHSPTKKPMHLALVD